MKKHYDEIDRLRGIAILMVILYHAIIVYPVNLHEITWCRTLHDFLWYLEMPLFFAVSGFCYSFDGKYGGYIWKKVKRILIPHLVFALLDVLPRVISNPFVHKQSDGREAVRDFLLYGGSDWFLRAMFVIFLVFPLFDKLYRTGKWGRIGMPVIVLLLYSMSDSITNVIQLRMAAVYLSFFTMGYLARRLDYDGTVRPLFTRGSVNVISLLMTAVFFLGYQKNSQSLWYQLIGGGAGGVFFYGAAAWIKARAGGLLTLCGKYSLQMYLLGGYALVATRTLLVSMLGISQPVFVILGNFVLDMVITLFISKMILDRWKVLRAVSGL